MKTLSLIFIFSCLLSITLASNFKVDPSSKAFIDEHGRVRVFHGVNAVYKFAPFHPPILDRFHPNLSLSTQDFQDMRRWGFTALRLHVGWDGVESVRGSYNMTLLDTLREITRNAAAHGINVLLDAHQDVASRKFCGEGFPDWAVERKSFPRPLWYKIGFDQEGYANIQDCLKHPFFYYGITSDVRDAFEDLYTNKNGLADSFGNFWATVAKHFKDEPNVIGYELMNEPSPARKYYLINPQAQDRDLLMPFYEKIHPAIRAVDDKTVILFEPTTTDLTSVGFTQGPGGKQYDDRQAFAYHVYCPFVNGLNEPKFDLVCRLFDAKTYPARAQYAEKLGVAGFLTEFGALQGKPAGIVELNRILGYADDFIHSWTYWQYKYFDDFTTAADPGYIEGFYDADGKLYTEKVKALARSYAYAICGVPTKMNFDPKTAEFTLQYKTKKSCGGHGTELFLSKEFYYPNGVEAKFEGCEGCGLSLLANEENYYGVHVGDNIAEGAAITLRVKPKSA